MGSTEVEQTDFAILSVDETAGVGVDAETLVSGDYTRTTSRSGEPPVQYEVGLMVYRRSRRMWR